VPHHHNASFFMPDKEIMTAAIDIEAQLQKDICGFVRDPYGFVMFAYPWGEPGTPLENETGPDEWQTKVLKDIGHALTHGWVMNNGVRIEIKNGRIWLAVRSGHGIGKSALMAWLDHWFASCHPDPQCITTANTDTQLRTKTWRENAKWKELLINAHWFTWTATKLIFKGRPNTWYTQAIPWSKHNTQAFAGTHEKYLMMKFDEASQIFDGIWEVTEGAMTEPNGLKLWIVFGNPTQATGRFSECFKKRRKFWITYEIDARTSKRTDKELIKDQIEFYGIDSDFVKVRILGQEPSAGTKQFIGTDIVEAAMGKVIHPSQYISMPKILGVDIARFGDDKTVFIKRQGLASYGLTKLAKLDSLTVAGLIAQIIKDWLPDQVFLDMGNTGAAIYDLLIGWGYEDYVTGIWFGGSSDDKQTYFNKRIEMVGGVKNWLTNGGAIPDDNELRDDITGPEYFFNPAEQMQLERAEDMKGRGLASPDCLMSLGLTFAHPVVKKSRHILAQPQSHTLYDQFNEGARQPSQQAFAITEYDIFDN